MNDANPDAPILFIRGELVGLGPLRSDLLTTYQRWMNDLQAIRHLGASKLPMTIERERAWLDSVWEHALTDFHKFVDQHATEQNATEEQP